MVKTRKSRVARLPTLTISVQRKGTPKSSSIGQYRVVRVLLFVQQYFFRLVHELIGKLSARKESFKDNKISVSQLGQLIDLVEQGTITRSSFHVITTNKLLCRI